MSRRSVVVVMARPPALGFGKTTRAIMPCEFRPRASESWVVRLYGGSTAFVRDGDYRRCLRAIVLPALHTRSHLGNENGGACPRADAAVSKSVWEIRTRA